VECYRSRRPTSTGAALGTPGHKAYRSAAARALRLFPNSVMRRLHSSRAATNPAAVAGPERR
jgi:hypothetical protein